MTKRQTYLGKIGLYDQDSLVLLNWGCRVGGGILEQLLRWHASVHGEVVVLSLLLREGHV
jgi:hypothetical protein